MSWFFGKKKQRDSPPDSPEDENPPSGQGDEFIFVERRTNKSPGFGINDGSEAPAGNLYPSINNIPQYPPISIHPVLPRQNIEPIQNILNGVPFQLCKALVHNLNDDIEIDRHRVNEILSYILRIEDVCDVSYDFTLEKSVINEIDSADNTM